LKSFSITEAKIISYSVGSLPIRSGIKKDELTARSNYTGLNQKRRYAIMHIYHLKRTQFLPSGIREAWDFFATPKNLHVLTPARMNIRMLSNSGGEKMTQGQIIKYKVRIFPMITVGWTTEILEVHEPFYFIDTQPSGPYSMWHHKHTFKEVEGGVEMMDEVNYSVPLGILGRLANSLFVNREVNRIFDYRFKVLSNFFTQRTTIERH
jgi:ligand-binding SRPBCC domain-containing protein